FSGGSFQNPGDLTKKYGTKTKEGEIVLTGIGSSQWTDGTAGPKFTYTWSASPETDITNKNSILASISPSTFETKVYLTVSNGYCSATDSSLVELEIEQIPAAFSPNGDNVNDTWQIDHLYLYKNVKITVFNKWGSPVYESSGYPKSKEDMWNGKSNGEDLPVAVYYYIIDFGKERGRAPLNGSVTIVR
ncbi:MAG: gliding motility-associated C-terminal domain-containing protein, partial [Cytophagales bacterium]|nr:gliding motility-associated C-terminal domain-containing protein [Cytophagales bacterium]